MLGSPIIRHKSGEHQGVDRKYIEIKSLAPDVTDYDNDTWTATMLFSPPEPRIPRLEDDDLLLDNNFIGFTPLNTPADDVSADIIAVTGLAGHAFGSWAHNDQKMWLRDYLPKDIQNRARVMIYGYESQLDGPMAGRSIISDFGVSFTQGLMDLRDHPSCRDRPLILIGHSLGALIIKQAIADLDPGIRSRLPVRTVMFFGAPHHGLEVAALETLVKGCPTQTLVSELKRDSPSLTDLYRRFRPCAKSLSIHSYYESRPTKTVIQGPDGKWERGGPATWMVPRSSALLYIDQEVTQMAVNGDHKEIARLRRGQGSVYPNVLRVIKDALKSASEQFAAAARATEEKELSTPASEVEAEPTSEIVDDDGQSATLNDDGQSETADDDGQWDDDNLLCDTCLELFPKTETHHHCYICDDGNFSVCRSCKKLDKSCPGGHTLLERRLGDPVTPDGGEENESEGEGENDTNLFCSYCDKDIPQDQVHFHCIICDDGDYDVCLACRKLGKICPGRHKMVKRQLPSKTTTLATTFNSDSETVRSASPATLPPPPRAMKSLKEESPKQKEPVAEYREIRGCNCGLPKRKKSPKPPSKGASSYNPLACRVCGSSCESKTQLFNHLREEDHMV
ncbi:hypothetical protein QBC40DRAFT_331209 [Triangularia verruculosa]|uniref:C2H2-type domain-containing protein n=1 Tax=Triangularia verruculosa TaxID=2587418 RepID=A0AAN6XEB1_9PEZI|nr:hypothetical protein QBC40DRAFT_331209 [Triangularia verruculosa]